MSVLTIILTIAISFLITVLLSPIIIPFLRRLKFGQSIREEGPKSHQAKSGTPDDGRRHDHRIDCFDNLDHDCEGWNERVHKFNVHLAFCFTWVWINWVFG